MSTQLQLQQIQIVLIGTTHPGNIGAVARAMKTMGIKRLVLVNPCAHLCEEALTRASEAWDILQEARVVTSLSEALTGCDLAIALSARDRSLDWPHCSSDRLGEWFATNHQRSHSQIAIVFGRESSGLSNEELQQCQLHVSIPTSQEFHSLNLSHAVQVMAYECHKLSLQVAEAIPQETPHQPASLDKLEGMLKHWFEVMEELGFFNPSQPKLLRQRLRRLFLRATPDDTEINILRGFLSAVQKKLDK